MKRAFFMAFLAFFSLSAAAKTWLVGPLKILKKPSQAAVLVADGDSVAIDAGMYEGDVCAWFASDLTLFCADAGGLAHLRANGIGAEGKAIWVIKGDRVRVEGIEFSACKVPDQNGAGIRAEGLRIEVVGCFFHDNEMGILTSNDPAAEVTIERSRFEDNGFGDGYSHNVYVGQCKSLVFRFNWSRRSFIGHLLKSRAARNLIVCNRLTSESGPVSREIDLPNGGEAIIIGNLIEQPSDGKNGNLIGYGLEGLSNPGPHRLFVCSNTLVNDRWAGSFVQVQNGTELVKMVSNFFVGPATEVVGSPAVLEKHDNAAAATLAEAHFLDAAAFDYRLASGSPAIGAGADAGLGGGESLLPTAAYAHPTGFENRGADGATDAGAFEFLTASATDDFGFEKGEKPRVWPLDESLKNWAIAAPVGAEVRLFDGLGRGLLTEKAGAEPIVFAAKSGFFGPVFVEIWPKKGRRQAAVFVVGP